MRGPAPPAYYSPDMRRHAIPIVAIVIAVALLALLTFGVTHQERTARSTPTWPGATSRSRRTPTSNCRSSAPRGPRAWPSFRGKVVVLNVFASWCEPCLAEAPILEQEQKQIAKDDATMLGVTYLDNSSASEQFVQQNHITYPVLRDVSGNFVRSFGTDGVPETFVINRQGRILALRRYQLAGNWLQQTVPRDPGRAVVSWTARLTATPRRIAALLALIA